jgi:hypothetical protein
MKNNIYFWSYLAQFFLEGEMLKIKFVQKIKHTFYIPYFFSRKSCCLLDSME